MGRKTFIALAGLVVVVIAGWLFFFSAPPPPTVPIPSPNGYDDIVEAGRLLVHTEPGFWELDHEKLRAYVLPNAEALKLARLGLTRQCRIPVEYTQAYLTPHEVERSKISGLLRALRAERTLAEMEHRTHDAVNANLDMVRLGHESSRGGFIIDALIGLNLETSGLEGLQRSSASIDGPVCREIITTLQILEAKRESPEGFMRRDKEQSRRTSSVKERIKQMIEAKSFDEDAYVKTKFPKMVKERQHQTGHLLIDLAARAFELEKGRRPQSIKELVPDYLKAVPKDPITGADLTLPR